MFNNDLFNPKVKDFLEKNPKKTMIGLFWSLYWRFYIFMLGISLLACLVFTALILIINIKK